MSDFADILTTAVERRSLLSLVLSRPTQRDSSLPGKITARPVRIDGDDHIQWTAHAAGQQTHENRSLAETVERAMRHLDGDYRHAHLFTTDADYAYRINKKGKAHLRQSAPTHQPAESTEHNRAKQYLIPEGTPCPFLSAIGVMTPDGKVRKAKYHKFRQINRFLEFVDDIYADLPTEGTLQVVDFGCGKSYLTFALHHLLTVIHRREVRIVGLDRRADVIDQCCRVAEDLNLNGLSFATMDITEYERDATDRVDLAVSLHACDTATDETLARAVAWQAGVVLAVPCCQHELARSIATDALGPLESHGILRERFAALATDSLRAAALDLLGYRTQVLEFIEMEHTAKNLLIRAVRRSGDLSRRPAKVDAYRRMKSAIGIDDWALERAIPALVEIIGES